MYVDIQKCLTSESNFMKFWLVCHLSFLVIGVFSTDFKTTVLLYVNYMVSYGFKKKKKKVGKGNK